ncbi:hypothetical protein C8J57DRAFT_1254605 [Mycena rebaudengoi]|nr:hypothetical protein C8J57DRAFT_1254605 [Mycena rebaudengoi]
MPYLGGPGNLVGQRSDRGTSVLCGGARRAIRLSVDAPSGHGRYESTAIFASWPRFERTRSMLFLNLLNTFALLWLGRRDGRFSASGQTRPPWCSPLWSAVERFTSSWSTLTMGPIILGSWSSFLLQFVRHINMDFFNTGIQECVGAANNVDEGAPLVIHNCNNEDLTHQDWTLDFAGGTSINPEPNKIFGDEFYGIKHLWAGKNKCLDLTGGDSTNGTPVSVLFLVRWMF